MSTSWKSLMGGRAEATAKRVKGGSERCRSVRDSEEDGTPGIGTGEDRAERLHGGIDFVQVSESHGVDRSQVAGEHRGEHADRERSSVVRRPELDLGLAARELHV